MSGKPGHLLHAMGAASRQEREHVDALTGTFFMTQISPNVLVDTLMSPESVKQVHYQ